MASRTSPTARPGLAGRWSACWDRTYGLVEARRPEDRAMFPVLERAHVLVGGLSVAGAVSRLRDALEEWTGNSLDDDVALLLVEQPGRPPAADVEDVRAAASRT